MIIIPLHNTPFAELVDQIARTLYKGGVVLVPTETVYGLIALASNKTGIEKISNIKNRDSNKQYQVLINSVEMATQLGTAFSNDAMKLAKRFWPGGMTLILSTAQSKTVGVRFPNHLLIQAIIDRVKEPLTATSANISGQPPLNNVKDISQYFGQFTPDLVIDSGIINGKPSTVINCTTKTTEILREGIITTSQIKEIIDHA